MLIFLIGIVSANNLEDMNFKVPSGFEKVEGAEGLQFVDESNHIRIRIFDADENDWDSSYKKYNGTVLIFNESTTMGDNILYTFSYGEYIIIDGQKYWVEVSNDDIGSPNSEKCLETLGYFNENNNFEPVEV